MPEDFQPAWQKQIDALNVMVSREEIGGWLLYFCIGFAILGPASLVRPIAASADLFWTITYLVLLIFTMLAGVTTWMRSPSALTCIWLALAVRLIFAILQFHQGYKLQGLEHSALATQEYGYGAGNAFLAVAWFWYFKVSSRVEQTFGRNL